MKQKLEYQDQLKDKRTKEEMDKEANECLKILLDVINREDLSYTAVLKASLTIFFISCINCGMLFDDIKHTIDSNQDLYRLILKQAEDEKI